MTAARTDNDYTSRRWRKLAHAVMVRDGYKDMYLSKYGKMMPAEMVHHIFPAEEYPQYFYEPWNLLPVSRSTHYRYLHRRDGSLAPAGLDLLERTARRQGLPVPPRPRTRSRRPPGALY